MTSGQALPPVPAYGRSTLADLVPSLLAGMGVPGAADVLGLDAGPRVCLLLVDGMGLALVRRHADVAPFISGVLGDRRLCAGFPTTTATSLGSLGTGLPPGEHGLLGYQVAVPGEGRLLNALRWDGAVDPLTWQPRPTAFERAAACGVAVTHVAPRAFERSGLTRAGLRGTRYPGADSVGERVAGAVAAVGLASRSLVLAYLGDLDATGHRGGIDSDAWREELAHTDQVVRRLSEVLPAGTSLVVTADHGMVDVAAGDRVDVDAEPALREGVALLGGEPRARYVYARPGAAADVAAAWTEILGDRAWVLRRDEAVAAGWFGPRVAEGLLARLGDVVVAARGTTAVVATQAEPRESALVGMHGSLTEDEVAVPLVRLRC